MGYAGIGILLLAYGFWELAFPFGDYRRVLFLAIVAVGGGLITAGVVSLVRTRSRSR